MFCKIKIYGDIHSGTRWVHALLSQNLELDIDSLNKHSLIPIQAESSDTLIVFIVRAFETWIDRALVQPYGIYDATKSIQSLYDEHANKLLHNYKIIKNQNSIICGLEYIQKTKGVSLLHKIRDDFKLHTKNDEIKLIDKHTKSHTKWWQESKNIQNVHRDLEKIIFNTEHKTLLKILSNNLLTNQPQ